MDPASYDITNNFEKMSLLVALLMDLLTTGGYGQTCYTRLRWLLSVAKVPDRWKHVIKQYGCYNKCVTVFGH